MRAEGWAKESRIDQGQELACEVSSDAVTKIKRFALANNYYNYYTETAASAARFYPGHCEMKKRFAMKSPLWMKEGSIMIHPAECYAQVDTSPLYMIEDNNQEDLYKDVRYPSTLQSRPPSMTSSLSAAATHAHKTPATSSVCTHSATAAQVLKSSQSCVCIKTSTPPPY